MLDVMSFPFCSRFDSSLSLTNAPDVCQWTCFTSPLRMMCLHSISSACTTDVPTFHSITPVRNDQPCDVNVHEYPVNDFNSSANEPLPMPPPVTLDLVELVAVLVTTTTVLPSRHPCGCDGRLAIRSCRTWRLPSSAASAQSLPRR